MKDSTVSARVENEQRKNQNPKTADNRQKHLPHSHEDTHRVSSYLMPVKIADISAQCGFNNISYFNRAFKQIMKKNPSEYRNPFPCL